MFFSWSPSQRLESDENMARYREVRGTVLADYCACLAAFTPDARMIVGIATEGAESEERSFDLVQVDPSDMTDEQHEEARQVASEEGWFQKRVTSSGSEDEYPLDKSGPTRAFKATRNAPCPCGSGRKFKRCHGRHD